MWIYAFCTRRGMSGRRPNANRLRNTTSVGWPRSHTRFITQEPVRVAKYTLYSIQYMCSILQYTVYIQYTHNEMGDWGIILYTISNIIPGKPSSHTQQYIICSSKFPTQNTIFLFLLSLSLMYSFFPLISPLL